MTAGERKPLSRVERLDVRRTFCFSLSDDQEWQQGAIDDKAPDYSSYIRDCIDIGHKHKQFQRAANQRRA